MSPRSQTTFPHLLLYAITGALLCGLLSCAGLLSAAEPLLTPNVKSRSLLPAWLPTADAKPVGNYWLAYDGRTRSARYVVELLLPTDRDGADRSSGFRIDRDAPPEARADADDYAGSGYDIGHLAASANHVSSAAANRATFEFSNAAPQNPTLNRGLWRKLETLIREYADDMPVLVVTAPLYLPDHQGNICLATIGDNHVWIPTHFAKAVLFDAESGPVLAAWLIPNDNPSDTQLADYQVSVDTLESALGVDLFAPLPDSLERHLESQ